VQRCTLLSIKTGGCPEDCGYCSQSSKHKEVGLKAEKLMDPDEVFAAALRAKAAGSTRFCMGAAWRGPSQVPYPSGWAECEFWGVWLKWAVWRGLSQVPYPSGLVPCGV
jgi:biotin synthase-like enzyme